MRTRRAPDQAGSLAEARPTLAALLDWLKSTGKTESAFGSRVFNALGRVHSGLGFPEDAL